MSPRQRPTREKQRPAVKLGAAPGDDAEVAEMISTVIDRLSAERLHIPDELPSEKIDLPFDLTEVTDAELQELYSAFTAYSYRSGWLLAIEEGKETLARQAADELVDLYLAEAGDKEASTKVKARAEQDERVAKWRRRQHRYGVLGAMLRKERDGYDKVCERLSRMETMRDNEFARAGSGRSGRLPHK